MGIAAPVRTHSVITPQVTNIVPEINVQNYNVDVPVAVPRAVPREIVQVSHVAKPYEVPVPRAVHVPSPYKVHPVQEIVETPHIHPATNPKSPKNCSNLNLFLFRRLIFLELSGLATHPFNFDPGETSVTLVFDAQTCNI